MWRVRLEKRDGTLHAHVLVNTYTTMPDVILYDQRIYQRGCRGAYREVFAIVAWAEEEFQRFGWWHPPDVHDYKGE